MTERNRKKQANNSSSAEATTEWKERGKVALYWSYIVLYYVIYSVGFLIISIAELMKHLYNHYCDDGAIIQNIQKKAIFITGCDSGFGLNAAQQFADLGLQVYASCLFPDQGEGLKLSKRKNVKVCKMDVTVQSDIDKAYDIISKDLSEKQLMLWSLVNNAGIFMLGDIEILPISDYKRAQDVNATGMVAVTKTFLPLLRASPEGARIVATCSTASRVSWSLMSAYEMSKHAALAFCNSLRAEVKPWDITVHTVEPGPYRTPMADFEGIFAKREKLWDTSSEELQKSQGREFFLERYKCQYEKLAPHIQPADKIHQVGDSIVHAALSRNPCIQYNPGAKIKLQDHVAKFLPREQVAQLLFVRPTVKPAQVLSRATVK